MTVFSGTSADNVFTIAAGNNRYDALGGDDTAIFSFKLTDATITYTSDNEVIVDTATSHTLLTGFQKYQFTDGTVDESDGSSLVADLFYYAQNHDVWAAGIDADAHYNTVGWKEGRDPNPFFDTDFYLTANPDVAAAGINPLSHFHTVGWAEGRDPSSNFSVQTYLAQNPAVAAAHVDPLQHFLQTAGEPQSSSSSALASATTGITSTGFDNAFYLAQNPDVAASGMDPYFHFQTAGWKEGRNPNAYFDVQGYLAENPDVAASGINPLDHFHAVGFKEGRNPSPWFDLSKYFAANPDIQAANVDPVWHFLVQGQSEGRVAIDDDVTDRNATANSAKELSAAGTDTGLRASWGAWAGVTYQITNDSSGGGFAVNASTGVITVADGTKLDFETTGPNHIYTVTVQGSKNGQSNTQTFQITVTNDVVDDGGFQSGDGGPVPENVSTSVVVYDAAATVAGNPATTYSLEGTDAALFNINASTGEVTFAAPPNFEGPTDSGSNNVYDFVVRAANGSGSLTKAVQITVTDVNEAPTINFINTTLSIAENTAVGGGIHVANISLSDDAQGANTTSLSLSGADAASFELRGNALFYIGASPNFEVKASYSVTVNADDTSIPGAVDATSSFTLNISNVNEAPVADADGPYSVAEDGSLSVNAANGVLAGDTDVDAGATLTAALVSGPAHAGSFTLNTDGSFNYTPAANFSGSDTFVYRTSDGTLFSDPIVVTINVTAQNDTPVTASASSFSGAEDVVYNGQLPSATDAEGSALTYALFGAPNNGSVVINPNGTFTFTPTANFSGNATFQYVANDGTVDSAPQTVTINFAAVNDAPVADADGPYAVAEDGSLSVNAAGGVLAGDIDIEGSGLIATLLAGPAHATSFTLNTDGSFTYTPAANFTGSDTFTYRAFDGTAFSDPMVVTINVTAQNDAPVGTAATFTINEDTPLAGSVSATDTEGSSLTYALVAGSATNGSATVNTDGTFTFTPTANFSGTATFQFTANDGTTGSAPQTVTINVTAVNDVPVATADSLSATQDGTAAIGNLLTNDTDIEDGSPIPGNITSFAVAGVGSGTVGAPLALGNGASLTVAANGVVTLTQNNAYDGLGAGDTTQISLTYTVTDSGGATDTSSAVITVSGVNDPILSPATTTADVTEDLDTQAHGNVFDDVTDLDIGDNHTVTAVVTGATPGAGGVGGSGVLGTYGTLTIDTNGEAHYELNNSLPAVQALNTGSTPLTDTFTYTVSDGLTSASTTITFSVHGTNDGPVARPDFTTVTEDSAVALNVLTNNDTDVDTGDTLSVVSFNIGGGPVTAGTFVGVGPGGVAQLTVLSTGEVVLNQNGAFEFLRQGETRAVSFSYTMQDAAGATDVASVTLTVTGANDAPTLDLNTATAGEDFATTATSGDLNTAISGNTAITDGLADAEGRIKVITLNLSAVSGVTDSGEGLHLPAGYEAVLESLGIATVTGDGSTTLTITATTAFSPDVAESIIEQIAHANPDTTFNFNPEDRSITVTVTDLNANANPNASDTQTTTIDMAANVVDTTNVGTFVGANRDDTIQGAAGDDTMEGRGGDDTIWGGTTAGDLAGTDIAVFSGNVGEYTITRNSSSFYTVEDNTAARDGTDSVHDAEILRFDDADVVVGAPILVLNDDGTQLLATFDADELDLAVNYANSHAGANQIELKGVSGPFTAGTWPVTITEAVTIKSTGGTATINAGANSGISVAASAVLGGADTVRLEGLNITGNGAANDTVGVLFSGAYDGPSDGAIQIVNTSVSGFGQNGIAIIGGGAGLSVTIDGDHPATGVTTETATITGSGGNSTGAGGSGDILFFEFTGAAALKNLVVTGTTGTSAASADNGIQIAGFDDGDDSIDHAIGAVTFQNVAVNGTYEKTLVYIQGYNNLSALGFAGGLALGNGGSAATWAALYIEPQSTNGTFTVDPTSSLNLTGVDVTAGTYGTNPAFAATYGGRPIVAIGTPGADTITGTGEDEGYLGAAGNDIINAGGGSDIVLQGPGGGSDTVNGGTGSDVLSVLNVVPSGSSFVPNPAATTITISDTELNTIDNSTATTDVLVDINVSGGTTLDSSVTMDNIEDIQIVLGSGGDTVTIGDLTGTAVETTTITVVGGAGNDTVDAGAIAATQPINVVFTTIGGSGNGDDKLVSGAGNDTFQGGTGGSDTLDLSQATSSVVASTGTGSISATGIGSDNYSGVENLTGGSAGDQLTGDSGANVLVGSAGDDTLVGGTGSDTLIGGTDAADTSSNDQATINASLTVADFSYNTGTGRWTVTSADGTDTLEGVEFVNHNGGQILLVDPNTAGGFSSIQAAIDAASTNDVILVAPGTYIENITVTKSDITLLSVGGRGATFIQPLDTTLDAINFAPGVDNVTIGNVGLSVGHPGYGFTITGGDGPAGIERAAVYLSGGNDNVTIRGNDLVANGDSALTTTGVTTTLIIDQNIISGKTFTGTGPAGGPGFANQFIDANYPRQLVVVQGSSTGTEFTNNLVTGTAGGISTTTSNPFGNTLVTIDSPNSTVSNNTFTGYTTQDNANGFFAHSLRIGGTGQTVTGNVVNNDTLGSASNGITLRNGATGTFTGNQFIGSNTATDIVFTTGNTALNAMTPGADTVTGNGGADFLAAGAGDDTINGGAGADTLHGQAGADTLNGGTEGDSIYGGAGDDVAVDGGDGDDTIYFYKSDGNDKVLGGAGTDDAVVVKNATFGFTGDTLLGGPVTFTVGAVASTIGDPADDILVQVGDGTGPGVQAHGSILMDQVEDISIVMGTGGDTVDITTPLGGTSLSISTITVTGGTGADKVNAGAMTSDHSIVFNGGAGNDEFVTGGGDDTYDGGDNTDTVSFASSGEGISVTLNGATAATVTHDGGGESDSVRNVENVVGSTHADTITGDGNDNVITANGGDDVLAGGAGTDAVIVTGAMSTYTVTVAPNGTITLNDGTDQIQVAADVENLTFGGGSGGTIDLTNTVRVLDDLGHLVATYDTITEAVDAATTLAGYTVQILGKVGAGPDYTEAVNVTKALSFIGVDVGNGLPTITSAGATFNLTGALGVGAVSFANLHISGGTFGILAGETLSSLGTLNATNVHISGTATGAIAVMGDDTLATIISPVANVSVTNSTFTNNGDGSSGGDGDLLFFGYSGNATLSGLTLTGDAAFTGGDPAAFANYTGPRTGIQFRADTGSIGNVSINGVTINGAYSHQAIGIFNYDSLDNLTIGTTTAVTVNADSLRFNTSINIDGITDDVNYSNASQFGTINTPTDRVSLQGDGAAQTITGDNDGEFIRGRDGADTLIGNGGDDLIVGDDGNAANQTNSGNDQMTGGGGNDTLVGEAGFDQANFIATELTAGMFSVATDADPLTLGDQAGWTITTGGSEGTDTVTGVEIVQGTDPAGPATGRFLLVGNGGYATIQDAIDAATAGDTVLVAPGTYNGNVALKSGVSLVGKGATQDDVLINGTMSTPASFADATVSMLKVQNVGNGMLLDMKGTSSITDAVFDHITFSLTSDFVGEVPIGNGQVAGSIAINDGADAGTAGLTFQHVVMASNNHNFPSSVAFVYTTIHSVGLAKMVLNDVTLSGTASGTTGGLGAQWNMTPNTGETARVDIVNSHTSGGGNFYVSGFDGVTIQDNIFDGQGLALNGVKNGTVIGNTFQNIDGTIWANEAAFNAVTNQHRGLVIEDAWGTSGVSNLSIHGNTFQNITAADGAIAFQRFNSTPSNTASLDRLNDVEVYDNTFTTVADNVYLNPTFFNADAVLQAPFAGNQLIIGTSGVDTITDPSALSDGATTIVGGPGADTINAGGGNDTIIWRAGDGSDDIDGGTDATGDDTLLVASNGSNITIDGDGTANPAEFTVSDGVGAAVVAEIEEVEVSLSSGNTLTVMGDFDGTGVNLSTITVTGTAGNETVNASAMSGAGAGSPVGIEFTGNGGDDTFHSGIGNDTFHGGTGSDTAVYQTAYSNNVTFDGTTATVTGARGTDTYDGVGTITFTDKTVWLVSKDAGSEYTEIAQLFDGNAANGEAAAGDVVLVSAGSYAGGFSIGVNNVTIKGAEAGVEIVGTFKSTNAISGSVADFLKTATSYTTTGDRGITVGADNVTIENLKVDGAYVGVELGNGVDHVTIKDVTIEDSVNGIRKGTGAQVTDLDLIGGEIRDSYIGMYLAKETADGLDISDVLIQGTKFTNLTEKGIYAESLANANITGIIMNNVGEYGRGASFGTAGQFGNGIDLNLKWDYETTTDIVDDAAPYSGITIQNFTFTNVGSSDKDGATSSHAGGAAIAVKARDQGSYASPEQASFSGAVVIQNGTINGTSVAVRAGEPNQNIADPDVTITNVTVSGEGFDVDNVTQSPMTVNMVDGGDILTAATPTTGTLIVNGGTGSDTVTTGAGNDTLKGNGGGDALDGAVGTDTAAYTQGITAAMITQSGGGWQVATGGGEGTDTLSNIEIIDGGEAGKILLVGNGGYATIQAAIDAASAGDTIVVASGTYDEDLVIDEAVTIVGAKRGVSGTGAGRDAAIGAGETTIIGRAHVTALGAVTIDGMRFLNDATTTNGGPGNPTLQLASGYDHVVTNSIFYSSVAGGVRPSPDDRAISTPVLADGDITISNNYFTGAFTGLFGGTPPASWGRAVWFDGGNDVNLTVTGNTIEYSRTGLNLDLTGTATATVNDNTFRSDGTAIAVGVDTDGLTVTNNDVQNVGDEFNFRNITSGVTFDADVAIDALTPAVPANPGNDAVFVLGGQGNDNLSGTEGVDVIDGNNLNSVADTDTLTGRGGDDILLGRAGNDSLDGGADNDLLDGGTGTDTMSGGTGNDTYLVDNAGDVLIEATGAGTDTVNTTVSYTLGAGVEVENLTLADLATRTETFENFTLGPISDGENGWKFVGGPKDQEVILDGANKVFRMSSDPSVGDFSGPYSPSLPLSAGEPGTSAAGDSHVISFDFRAVQLNDFSRLELDLGNASGTDRNSFMVIENTASGIRIAVADALPDGNFDTGPDLNNFTPYTGNRELVSGVNAGAAHTLSMVARYVAGANNDVVDIYLDGSLIGTTTTFENFHDAQPGNPGHLANAEANLTNRLFFRGGGTVVNDGAGAGQNQGFLFDNIQNAVFNSGQSLTGNEFAQTITGNAGDNTLIGLGANDAIVGGLGRDTAVYTQTITAAMITQSGGGWQVAAGGAEATDTLTGVEVVQGADPDGAGVATGKFLLVGNGGYASIAAAYGAAVDGDTIVIASGTYTENLTIDKEITIVGANRGIAGDGSRGAESEIVGGLHITSSNVTVDGVKITDGRVDYGYQRSGVFIDGAQDNITIKNSIIDQPTAHGESFQHGIITTYNAATGNLQVLDNLISHWNEGMYLNPGVHDATFSGNAFADNGNHIVSDAIDDFTVTNNDFGDSEGSKIFVNVYDNPTDLQSELGLAGNTFALDGKAPLSIAPLGADGQVVLGTSIGDRFRGDFAGNPTQTFEGRGGDDSLIGGAGTDTARYGVDVTATDISAVSDADPYVAGNQAGWQVAAGSEGTDLLVGMEIVDDATGGKYLLVGNGGFATIQDALTAASDGDTILIAAGTWSGAGNAGLTVDKTVTFIGMGATIDASGFSYGFDVNMATDKLAGTVTFKNLTIDNAASSGINSRDQQVLGTLTLDGVTITDSGSNGFYASGRKASTAYAQAGVQNVNILNSTFTNNGLSAINAANIMLFEFDGNATITNVTASNSIAGGAFGIQIAGFDSGFYDQLTPNSGYPGVGSYDVLTAMGTVALDQVNITGTYLKPGFYVQGYTDTTGLTITSSTVNVDSTSWDKPVIIDPMADQLPTGTPGTAANPGSFFDETSANGSYNLSGLNVTQQGTQLSELDGTTKADTIVGTNAIDQITGFGGADNLSGGAGNDVFIIAAGTDHAAGESINGGADTDVIRFTSTTAGDTLTLTANVAAVETVVISDAAGVTTGTTALNVNASAVTGVISLTGNDGDNVLTGNGSANTIIGGGGIDTIDAGGGIDTVSAGNGNDIVVGTADGVSDVYDGGTGTDTIDYSALTIGQSISVNLGTGGASGSAIGSDNLSGSSFENVNAGGGNDSLFGSLANNVIHGGAGSDNIVGDAGSDTLFGEADNDTLNGGTNDFVLTPGAANDVLWGGLGTDTFRFEGRFGDDTIGAVGTPDWTDGEDLVFVGYSAASPIIVDTANGALITINDGFVASSVLVAGATAAQMSVVVSGSDLIIH